MKENKIAGVYKITNNITGEFYIGSSKNIKKRWHKHRSLSGQKQLPNSKLYKAMASYGLDNFTFEIIEKTDNLREREQYYIEHLKPVYNSVYAKGCDIERYERYKESNRRYKKEWYKVNRDEQLIKSKNYHSRLCLYEGETLTLRALALRLFRQGIPHSTLEAKKYLIEKELA